MSMKNLVGKKLSRTFKFMNEDIKINKLSVAEVLEIQAQAKEAEKDDSKGLTILRLVIRSAVDDAAELSDEDFDTFPMEELSKLSNEIMKFSGLGDAGK